MSKEMNFAIFCIENYKSYKNLTGKAVIALFERYGVLQYLCDCYDVLHTTGYQYLNQDIDAYLSARGVKAV